VRIETYSQRGNSAFEAEMAARTASRDAAFLLPHLRPGMRLLDAGCGPGSITLGLAEAVAPGEAFGIDRQPAQVELARALAAARGVAARFDVGDIYRLPFPDASFDAVFANGVLMHLGEPVRALAELRRVLRPGGIAGVRDPDFGASVYSPVTPLLERWLAVRVQVRRHNGGDPFVSRRYRQLLLEAGFAHATASATVDYAGSPEETRRHAVFLVAQLGGFARTAAAQGWMDRAAIDDTAAEIDAWARRPDAFFATTWCQALGWTDARPRSPRWRKYLRR
jgi:ubiquinone/menaquinone biosynthesis C-methylase UbiE